MLADELDYVVGVDTHRDEHVLALVAAPAGAVVAGKAVPSERARLPRGAPLRGALCAGQARLGDRGHRQLRRRPCPLSRRAGRNGARAQPYRREPSVGCRAKTTHSTPSARRGRHSPARRSRCREQVSGARRCGCCWSLVAAPSTSAAKRSRSCAPDRHRPRAAPRRAPPPARRAGCSSAAAACAAPAQRRRARDPARAAQPRPPHPGRPPSKLPSSSTRSSPRCAHSLRRCSTSRASDRSSPPS